jgi:SAM-dependent methyltransferase
LKHRPRACPACQTTDASEVLKADVCSAEGEQYRIVGCTACGLRYTRPLPTEDEFISLYREDYYSGIEAASNTKTASWLGANLLRRLFRRAVIKGRRRAVLTRQTGRVLDVGCGNGDFLVSLKERGWEAYGTDFSNAACEFARAKGISVHQGPLASASFSGKLFDVVTLWHVLEHLSDPTVELIEIRRILRDDGLLIIQVPNSNSITLKLCGIHWLPLDLPRHLQHFTPSTLNQLLRQTGFTPASRQDFHLWECVNASHSFMGRFGITHYLKIRHLNADFQTATVVAKALYLIIGSPIAALCIPYSILTTVLGGNGEAVTITARKTKA